MFRQRRFPTNKKAPERICRCDHPPYLHKDWTSRCVVAECGCVTYRQVGKEKYFSTKADYKGTIYQSILERDYAFELDLRQKAGDIKEWESQFKVSIDVNGVHICNHYIDFRITHPDGSVELVETKGFETDVYRLKRKLLEATYLKENPGVEYTVIKR